VSRLVFLKICLVSLRIFRAINTFLPVNASLHWLNNVSCLFLSMNWRCENTAKICTSNHLSSSADGLYRKLSSYLLAHFCLNKKSAKVLYCTSPLLSPFADTKPLSKHKMHSHFLFPHDKKYMAFILDNDDFLGVSTCVQGTTGGRPIHLSQPRRPGNSPQRRAGPVSCR
jgi:hypothetical protein